MWNFSGHQRQSTRKKQMTDQKVAIGQQTRASMIEMSNKRGTMNKEVKATGDAIINSKASEHVANCLAYLNNMKEVSFIKEWADRICKTL